jgi:oligoendopeptidase F
LQTSGAQEKLTDYSNTPRKDVPVEFTWRIEDLFETKEDWDREKERIFSLIDKIDELAPGWTSSPARMLALYKLVDEIRMGSEKLSAYARHQSNMDLGNPLYRQMTGELQSRFIQLRAKLSFMQDDILKLGAQKFAAFLDSEPGLAPYAFGVQDILRQKDHILPPDQQKILSMTGLFSGVPSQASGVLNNLDIPNPKVTLSDGDEIILNYPTYSRLRSAKNPEDRQLVMDTFWSNIKKYENTFAVLLDGAMKNHVFHAEVRNFDSTLEARLSDNNIDEAVYHMLIKKTRENLDILHRYLLLKKEMLGLEAFKYVDMYASAVKSIDKVFGWDEAKTLILEALKPLGSEYVAVLEEAFGNRWIDRFPNRGKQSGAYSSGIYGVHPFVKMNYTGNYSNVSTLAHELGHALHSYLSDRTQPYSMADYSPFLAEIASTFNEHLLVNYLIQEETDDLFKLYILDSYINGIKGTVYRQVHFAEYELAMHQHAESGQTLTAQWLNDKFLETTRDYYGHDKGITQVDDYIQNEWSVVPHFFLNYYVYAYATGMIASSALTEMVMNEGEEGRRKYLAFLSSGGSDYPLNILKKAGVDMTQPEPYEAAFKRFGSVVSEMEKLVKKLKE